MRLGVAAVLLGTALLPACASHQARAAADPAVPVTVAIARTASFSSPLELSGTIGAPHTTTLGAAYAGRIVSVDVQVGDRVAPGQRVAQVDASQYAAQLAGARAGASAAADNRRAAQAQLAQAQSKLRLAEVTARRMSQLYAQGAISKQQHDETQSDLAAARAGVAQAQAGLSAASGMTAQAQAGISAAAVPLRDAAITAPYAGIVTQKFVDPGAVVGAGSPVVAIQDTSDLELDVALPEDNAAALVPGSSAVVRVDALNGARIPARVRAVIPSQDPALRSATVKLAVSPKPGLLPGMFARVRIAGAAHAGIGVPPAAVVTRAGQSGVFVVRAQTASFVPVQTGASTDRAIEVQGVRANSRVAVGNVQGLTDGATVTVTP